MNTLKTIYRLTIEDIQTVAEEELGRKLTDDEIKKVSSEVSNNINWYDSIALAISHLNVKSTAI